MVHAHGDPVAAADLAGCVALAWLQQPQEVGAGGEGATVRGELLGAGGEVWVWTAACEASERLPGELVQCARARASFHRPLLALLALGNGHLTRDGPAYNITILLLAVDAC